MIRTLFKSSNTKNLVRTFTHTNKNQNATETLYMPLRMIILGAPGAGKGTICNLINEDFNLVNISTGNILRKHIIEQTELGLEAHNFIKSGLLVPDKIILSILETELSQTTTKSWLLDGFPRTINQVQSLDNMLNVNNVNLVVHLDVSPEVILNRVADRWIHIPSGRVYNLQYNPPKVAGLDDVTGEPLVRREDDQLDIIKMRLDKHQETMLPIVDYYDGKNLLINVRSSSSDDIYKAIKPQLANRFFALSKQF